jgi:hypothetical protein
LNGFGKQGGIPPLPGGAVAIGPKQEMVFKDFIHIDGTYEFLLVAHEEKITGRVIDVIRTVAHVYFGEAIQPVGMPVYYAVQFGDDEEKGLWHWIPANQVQALRCIEKPKAAEEVKP